MGERPQTPLSNPLQEHQPDYTICWIGPNVPAKGLGDDIPRLPRQFGDDIPKLPGQCGDIPRLPRQICRLPAQPDSLEHIQCNFDCPHCML